MGCQSHWHAINKHIHWRTCFLLFVIDIFSNYTWVIPLEDTKGVTIINAFQKNLQESKCKQKIWVVEGSEFYHRSMKLFSQNNNTEMHSMHNEGKYMLLLKDLLEP